MTSKTAKQKRKNKRWPGLIQDAAALGVAYGHLRLCLVGARVSARLMKRYHALKSQASTATPSKP